MFSFVMKTENLTFPEAVEKLAARAGVVLKEETESDKIRKDKAASLYELNERIQSTFHHLLLNDKAGEKALEYVKNRGITDETIEKFQLGFAPDDPYWLYNFLKKKSYSDEFLKESGFFSQRKFPYSLFSNRLMFPVRNNYGKTIAFGARDLSFRENAPKYINTPETAVYSKKHSLYGFYEALESIKKEHEAIICEGNFDAISLQQAHVSTAVAPFGTAFTSEQADLLRRYCDKIKLLFDSDEAGQVASEKAVQMLHEKDIAVEVLQLEGVKDSSELLEKEGPQALKKAVEKGIPGFEYLVTKARNRYDLRTPKSKSEFVSSLAPFINATERMVERDGYIKRVAEIVAVKEEQVWSDIRRAALPRKAEREHVNIFQETTVQSLVPSKASPDLYMMLMLANHRDLFPRYTNVLKFGDLRDGEAQMIFLALENVRREETGKTNEVFLSYLSDRQATADVEVSFETDEFQIPNEEAEKVIDELLDRNKLRKYEDERKLVYQQLKLGEQEALDEEGVENLLIEITDLDKQITELKAQLMQLKED